MVLLRHKDGYVFKIKSINQYSVNFTEEQLESIESGMSKAIEQDKCPICVLDDAIEDTKLCGVASVIITMNDRELFKMTVSDSSILTEEFLKHCLNFFIHD